MKKSLIIVFLLTINFCLAQKQTTKQWDGQLIEKVTINGEGIFKIKIKNSDTKTIGLGVKFAGEHSENLVVVDSLSGKTLQLSVAFQPLFKADNDKLSAHKVLSVELELTIPKHINLNIKSDIAQTEIIGTYPNVFIELKNGNCKLDNFLGNATVNTINGNIDVNTNNAKIMAQSKTGQVNITTFKLALHQLNLLTVNGHINVSKI